LGRATNDYERYNNLYNHTITKQQFEQDTGCKTKAESQVRILQQQEKASAIKICCTSKIQSWINKLMWQLL
jgi:membrane fusion protein (multidrug efflux system)